MTGDVAKPGSSDTGPSPMGRRALVLLLGVLGLQGYLIAVNTGAAAFLARDFGLDAAGVARVFGWHALGALGTFALARQGDRQGRRWLLLISMAGASVTSLLTAVTPALVGFITAQVAREAFSGALLAAGTVVIAEELPRSLRARGQSAVGIALAVGGGIALVATALLADIPGSWRWAWVFSGVSLLALLPAVARSLPETARFRKSQAIGEARGNRFLELFEHRYRRRTAIVLVHFALAMVVYTVTHSWLIFHPERDLGMAPLIVTGVVIGAGAVALVGNPLGARLADRIGRRATVAISGVATSLAGVAYYWVPAAEGLGPVAALAALFFVMSLFDNVRGVAYRAATTELFPTRLRGTLQGSAVVIGTGSAVVAQFATAALAETLHGLTPAISLLALGSIPGCLLFLWLPETSGELEESSLAE